MDETGFTSEALAPYPPTPKEQRRLELREAVAAYVCLGAVDGDRRFDVDGIVREIEQDGRWRDLVEIPDADLEAIISHHDSLADPAAEKEAIADAERGWERE